MPLDPSTLQSIVNSIQQNFQAGQAGVMQNARAKVNKWANTIYNAVKAELPKLYMPGTPSVYRRTGQLLHSAELVVGGSSATAKATIRFQRRSTPSFFGGQAMGNLMAALDLGYQVKAPVWFRDRAYMGYRGAKNILANVAARYVAAAAADGVTVTFN